VQAKFERLLTPSISNKQSIKRCVPKLPPNGVPMTAVVNKNTSGTDFLPTIQTTIVEESSWIGSYSRPVVFAGAIQLLKATLRSFLNSTYYHFQVKIISDIAEWPSFFSTFCTIQYNSVQGLWHLSDCTYFSL
jgi:hypothetical protein